MNSEKIFVDTVHGQIRVPNVYCKKIIDTVFFQRLRRIEQTSMRSIYPCAHHDRFVHSLGTYHIGQQMFREIESSLKKRRQEKDAYNLYEEIRKIELYAKNNEDSPESDAWSTLRRSFELACLLHDCGHAPFSHTFEAYFYNDINTILKEMEGLCKTFLKKINSWTTDRSRIAAEFVKDIKKAQPKKHELVSAWMVMNSKAFVDVIYDLKADPILMARMITGAKFVLNEEKDETRYKEKNILNCFISLLNGHEIDADRLDYALRDKWASGLNSVNINSNRLTSSITLSKNEVDGNYVVCFKKQALPDLQVLIENKNYTSFWVFGHHKTEYQQDLLIKAVEKLAILFSCDSRDCMLMDSYLSFKNKKKQDSSLEYDLEDREIKGAINKKLWEIFNYTNLVSPKSFDFYIGGARKSESLYLTSDDDVVHLLKKYFCIPQKPASKMKFFWEEDNYALEWFQRTQVFIPIWKSYSEYMANYVFKYKELARVSDLVDSYFCKKLSEDEFKGKLEDRKSLFEGQEHLLGSFLNYIKMPISKKRLEAEKRFEKDLRHTLSWYKLAIKGDFEKALKNVIEELVVADDYELKYKTIKSIPNVIEMKEVKPEALHILFGKELCCYTQLELPKKSEQRNYNFFYLFAPRIYFKGGEEMDKDQYKKAYAVRLQSEIERITHVGGGDGIKYSDFTQKEV